MTKYKCIIVDDEPIAIRVIKNHLLNFEEFEVVAECNNAMEAMKVLRKEPVDLIFLDIEMPTLTGLDFIQSLDKLPKVIFTTAHRNYAVEAFDLNAFDYLLKPISFERFVKSINRFLDSPKTDFPENKSSKRWILVKSDKKLHKVSLDEILYIESLADYVVVYLADKKLITKERISHMEENLPNELFLRIHRGFIVNIEKIDAFSGNMVEISGIKIPIGRNYKENVETRLLAKQ